MSETGAAVRTAVDGRWSHERIADRLRLQAPLLVVWTAREFRVRYRQSLLGVLWSVVQPLATLAVFGAVMAGVLDVGSEGHPYISFAYCGLVIWTFFSSGLSAGLPSLLNAGAVVGKVYFPREVVPLASVGACCVDLLIGNALLIVILIVQGVGIDAHLLALIPIELTTVLYVAGLSVLLSALTVFVRDVRYALPLILQLLFIATPVMYPASLIPEGARWINSLNPLAVLITGVHDAVLDHVSPRWELIALHALIGAVLLFVAAAYMRSVEPRVVDVL